MIMLILKLFEFLFYTLPLILASLYFFVAIFALATHIVLLKKGTNIPIGQWVFAIFNGVYIVLFLVTLIFFFALWKTFFSGLGLLSAFVSFIWSRYDEKKNGRRWWKW